MHVASESGSPEVATQVVDGIAKHFWLLALFPYLGHRCDEDLRSGLRSLVAGDYVIIHVLQRRRDLSAFFGR